MESQEQTSSKKSLTRRQRQVLAHAALGHTMKKTAEELDLKVDTIKDHRRIAMRNLDAKTISNAVAIAIRKELIR